MKCISVTVAYWYLVSTYLGIETWVDLCFQDASEVDSKCATVSSIPANLEGSTCSLKSKSSSKETPHNSKSTRFLYVDDMSPSGNAPCGSRCDIHLSGNLLHKYDTDHLSLQNSPDCGVRFSSISALYNIIARYGCCAHNYYLVVAKI